MKLISTLMMLLGWMPVASSFAAVAKPFLVVIDPGHGGADHGAIHQENGMKVSEKDMTLRLSQEVARQLRNRGIRTVLTRDADQDIPLPDRTAMANRLGADVFLSIHMNSAGHGHSDSPTAQGVETYILNHSTTESSKRLADLENSVLKDSAAISNLTQGVRATPHGSDVALIVKDLMLDGNLTESRRLACITQNHLVRATSLPKQVNLRDRGVKQGLFYVLLGADMPSILVEAGFLNNTMDRSLVLSPSGRTKIASAITRALVDYRANLQDKSPPSTRLALNSCKVH